MADRKRGMKGGSQQSDTAQHRDEWREQQGQILGKIQNEDTIKSTTTGERGQENDNRFQKEGCGRPRFERLSD